MSSIPIGWKYLSLGEVAKVTSGGTPDRQNKNYWGGKIPWISTGEINFNSIYASRECITEEGLKHSSAKLLSPGIVLMAMYGQGLTRGRVAVLQVMGTVNQNCAAIVVEEDVSAEYIYQYLSHHYDDIRSLSHYGGIDHLNNTLVRAIKLPLPPLAEQRKIAAILGTWDAAIDRAERLVAALKARKKALMQRLLTGEVRFPGFAGEWTTEGAGNLFEPVSKRNAGTEELLSVTQERGVLPRSMLEGRVVMPEGSRESYKLVEPGNFIISLRSFQGGLEYSQYRGIVSPAYNVLRPKQSLAEGFYKHYFKSREFIARLGVAIIGIRDGKQISYSDFAALKLPHPSLSEQARIAEVLDQCDELISRHDQELQLLRSQKRGLMQRLLTGEVRVAVDG